MEAEKEYKTSFSSMFKITTIQTLDEWGLILKTSRSDVGRKIVEYFIEHNDVEDLQEWKKSAWL